MTEKINENECESESENEAEFGVKTYAEKEEKPQMKKIILWIAIIVIFLFCIVMAAILCPFVNNENLLNQKDAFYTLQDLMDKEEDFNEDDHKSFDVAFNAFDTNNDGSLNETEFVNYIKMELDYAKAFETIDADKDDIISYPEAVVYIKEINKIALIKQYSLNSMLNAVQSQYGFEYLNESESSFDTFLEYVAILIYFESVDTDFNGYIHHNEYSTMAAKDEFVAYDLDRNGEIGHDAFFDILYGDNEYSWKGKLIEMFGDEYQETMNELGSVVITNDMVQNTEIRLCPIQILRKSSTSFEGYKRRLACKWYCELVYDSNCDCIITKYSDKCQ